MIAERLERRNSNMAKDNYITHKREYTRELFTRMLELLVLRVLCVWCGGVWWCAKWKVAPLI